MFYRQLSRLALIPSGALALTQTKLAASSSWLWFMFVSSLHNSCRPFVIRIMCHSCMGLGYCSYGCCRGSDVSCCKCPELLIVISRMMSSLMMHNVRKLDDYNTNRFAIMIRFASKIVHISAAELIKWSTLLGNNANTSLFIRNTGSINTTDIKWRIHLIFVLIMWLY